MLGRGTVAQVVRPVPVVRAGDVLETTAATGGLAVVVDDRGAPQSLVFPQDAANVPRDRWVSTPVSALARVQPAGWVATTRRDDDLTEVVTAIQESQSPVVVAVDEAGRVLGIATVEAVNAVLEGR